MKKSLFSGAIQMDSGSGWKILVLRQYFQYFLSDKHDTTSFVIVENTKHEQEIKICLKENFANLRSMSLSKVST